MNLTQEEIQNLEKLGKYQNFVHYARKVDLKSVGKSS